MSDQCYTNTPERKRELEAQVRDLLHGASAADELTHRARHDVRELEARIEDLKRRLAESDAGAAKLREVLIQVEVSPFIACACELEYCTCGGDAVERIVAAALLSTAGADLLREVEALRALELALKTNCVLTSMIPYLDAVSESRKPR